MTGPVDLTVGFFDHASGSDRIVLGDNNVNFGRPTGTTANTSGILRGGVIGAGVEYALGPHWTVGGEFLHTTACQVAETKSA